MLIISYDHFIRASLYKKLEEPSILNSANGLQQPSAPPEPEEFANIAKALNVPVQDLLVEHRQVRVANSQPSAPLPEPTEVPKSKVSKQDLEKLLNEFLQNNDPSNRDIVEELMNRIALMN